MEAPTCTGGNPLRARPTDAPGRRGRHGGLGVDSGVVRTPSRQSRQGRGSALLLVLVIVALLGALAAAGYAILANAASASKIELELEGQTTAIAESGLTEALSWFRRSPRQPVQVFDPVIHEAEPRPKKPPAGIVREFEVSAAAKLWGRYEVTPESVEDVTAQRGRGDRGAGTVWRVRSTGWLYVRDDPAKPWNEAPNRVVHHATVETEFQRLAIRPPARAGLLADRGDSVTIARGGRVRGATGAAIVYRQGTGRPALDRRAEVTSDSGAPVTQATARSRTSPAYDLSEIEVFGVRPNELKTLADVAVDSTETLTGGLPQLGIVYIDGDAVFDERHPLRGGGVLYVNGDLRIERGANASFFGQVYVAGDLVMEAPSVLSGSVLVLGRVDVRGSGDVAEIAYNEDILSVVRQKLGQYRIRRTVTRVFGES